MEWKTPQKLTPLDLAVTDNNLQALKLLLPYVPSEIQPMLGIYVKFAEFQNTLSYFRYFTRSTTSMHKTLSMENIIHDLKDYYPDENFEMMENMVQAMNMMEMMQGMNMDDMFNSMNMGDIFQACKQERKDNNGNMDESSRNEKS